ncbi:MAG: hypothetical protein KJO23_06770 [Bacteroidia bacterium]|nr:hypothetical protein [Bacteroidia bacterium]
MRSRQTDNRKSVFIGVLLILILIATPFLFYLYRLAPAEGSEWKTFFGTIKSGGFSTVQSYIYTLFTKLTFVLLTGVWFLTSRNWWKYAILVPFTMFLFQLSGVINHNIQYIDEFDFWYSLPVILPILFFLIYISILLSRKQSASENLKDEMDEEINKIFSDEL